MRDIKFRAWVKEDKELCEVYTLSKYRVFVISDIPEDETMAEIPLHGVELMQYTGLKDKNGVEIYEGDIITADNGNSFRIVFFEGAFIVFFEGAFRVARLGERIKIVIPLDVVARNKDCKVVGNIHENPELLEE